MENATKYLTRRQTVIFSVLSITSAEMRDAIEFKIPADFETIDSVMFSATDPGVAPTTAVFGANAKNNVLGTLSLLANNKESHPLHWKVQVKPLANLQRKFEGLRIETPVEGNTRLQGYYIDAGNSTKYPYDLHIYLKGVHRIPLRSHV